MSNLWTQALGQLRSSARRSELQTYFEKMTFAGEDAASVRLSVPDARFRDYVSTYLLDQVRDAIARAANRPVGVQLVLADEESAWQESQSLQATLAFDGSQARTEVERVDEDALAPRFTFETFVVGTANELATAAAQAVAERPGLQFNQIGRTHV